jgi:PAS domain S-box-containing protein
MNRIADLVLESATDYAIITMDLTGHVTYWSPGAETILGWSSEEALGRRIEMIFSPEDRANDVPAIELGNALTHGRSIDERWHVRKDGSTFWASGEMLPLVDGGPPEGFLKILRDRTAQKRAEELQHLLTQELGHRIKNMIAVTQSIVNQSFRGATDLDAVKLIISRRLSVLSSAQDILLAGNSGGASMDDLVHKAIGVAKEGPEAGRIRISGAQLHVGPRAAMSIALILHELLTNAFKYGALSRDEGHVEIAWWIGKLDDLPALELVWTEAGGPAVVPPTRVGFGSKLVKSGITGARSVVELDYAAQGLQCRIAADLASVQKE